MAARSSPSIPESQDLPPGPSAPGPRPRSPRRAPRRCHRLHTDPAPAPWPLSPLPEVRRPRPLGLTRRGPLPRGEQSLAGAPLCRSGCSALFLSRASPHRRRRCNKGREKVRRGAGALRTPGSRLAPSPLPTPAPVGPALRSARAAPDSGLRRARGGAAALGLFHSPSFRSLGRGPAEPIHSVQETSRVFLTSPYFCD